MRLKKLVSLSPLLAKMILLGGAGMKLDYEARVNALTIVTSLVIAFVRHGRSSKWSSWAWETALTSWFVHCLALYLLIGVSAFAVSRWHRIFLGSDPEVLEHLLKFQYYATMTVLVATAAIGFLSGAGPFSEADDF